MIDSKAVTRATHDTGDGATAKAHSAEPQAASSRACPGRMRANPAPIIEFAPTAYHLHLLDPAAAQQRDRRFQESQHDPLVARNQWALDQPSEGA